MKRILALLLLLMPFCVFADHYFGGYINYTHVGGFTYDVEVVTYSDVHLGISDRDSVVIVWGDGGEEFLLRTNNAGDTIYPGVKKNIYEGRHTFQKEGNYQVIFKDIYRMFDVNNMTGGRSGTSLLYFDAIIAVADTFSYCINTSAKTIYDPYMRVKTGEPFQMNLTHYDEEGDSLSFKLINPKALNGLSVSGYWTPAGVSLDEETGFFTWDDPSWGIYIFAYEIQEYRDGVQIGHSIVDFPIYVDDDEHERGTFTTIENTVDGVYDFNGAGSEDFMVSYENLSADSVFIEIGGGFEQSLYFNGTEKSKSKGKQAFDTLSLNYLGNDKQQGGNIITFRASSIFGSDTILDFLSLIVNTKSDTTWGCTVPPDIKYINKVAPELSGITIAPSLFSNEIWVNLGTSFADMKVEVFDIRGRMVYQESNFETETVQFNLYDLRYGMYFFRFWRKDEIVTILKGAKR
jgi:hypothetical protein